MAAEIQFRTEQFDENDLNKNLIARLVLQGEFLTNRYGKHSEWGDNAGADKLNRRG